MARETPLRDRDRPSPGVPQGVYEEVFPDVLVELAVAYGVSLPRGDLIDLGLGGTVFESVGDRGDYGVHHVVYGNEVYDGLRFSGELSEDAPGKSHDYRVGHA